MIGNNLLLASGDEGYNLTRSLRTRASASANLSRTFGAAPTVRTQQTLSVWFKRGALSTEQVLMAGYDGVSAGGTRLVLLSGNTVEFHFAASTSLITTQVFRDPSAWYHLVLSIDTTQATASNRVKLYVNGSQITAFGTANYPSQNALSQFTLNNGNNKIASQDNNANYFDGYLTEVNFIDGQALTPSSFGETDLITGVWKPKAFSGTYGTNGFELQFTDNSAATAAAIGKDSSGNGNNWTPNNISVTAGVTYDSMTDVPTLTSATASNFAVLNPLFNSTPTLSAGNLNHSVSSTSNPVAAATIGVSSGKWYWEVDITSSLNIIGIIGSSDTRSLLFVGGSATSYSYYSNTGVKYNNSSATSYGASFTTNDVMGVALDLTAGTLTFYKNGVSQGTAFSGLSGTFFPACGNDGVSSSLSFNFGQRPFSYAPPTGFVALNTFNLPTSTIVKGNTVMDATLWTGTGSNPQVITNAAGFKPDLVWLKSRSAAFYNQLADSIRGANKSLYSNTTDPEDTNAINGYQTVFSSNGFSVTAGSNSGAAVNGSGTTYVGWQWQAGQGTTSSNTNGTITSTVSVNASAGFSVVSFAVPATTSSYTIGHGLGVAPSLIFVKGRDKVDSWVIYHSSVSTNTSSYLVLNSTSATLSLANMWGTALPTSSVFGITANTTIANNQNVIAYCWSEIAGFSKFGSYTGNGSADGTFVYLGFRPKFVLIKRTDTTSDWRTIDTSRDTFNGAKAILYPNLTDAEASVEIEDILSNGFKLRINNAGINGSGGTYIYMAYAENPFKNALAR
jgi:hypothetical protein